MPTPIDAQTVLQREQLPLRAKILEIAASLDRLDRAGGSLADDPRMTQIRQAITALGATAPGRAEQIQLLFSLPYDDAWRQKFGLPAAGS